MTSSKRYKGNKVEVEACDILVSDGYTVWRPSSPRYFKPHSSSDIFGLYDIVAIRDREIRWIQVKSEPYVRSKLKEEIESLWLPGTREVWLRVGDEWKITVWPE